MKIPPSISERKSSMIRNLRFLVAIIAILIFGVASGSEENYQKIPVFSAHVVDQTGWMTSQEVLALNKKISNIEKEGKVRIGVLIVSTVKPETIEQYSIRVAEVWKVGQKKVDNGLLFIIAKEDRKARIEVGYGLEGAMPDITVKRILSDTMTPELKSSHPYNALVSGIDLAVKYAINEPVQKQKIGTTEELSIPFWDDLTITSAKILVVVLGIIGGIFLLIGGYSGSLPAFLSGLGIPIFGGVIIGVLFFTTLVVSIVIASLILAVMIALGITIGGGAIAIGGGAFGGGGGSIDF